MTEHTTTMAEPVHLPGCTAAPTVSGERPYLLVVRNVRTGHVDVTCTACKPDKPKENQ